MKNLAASIHPFVSLSALRIKGQGLSESLSSNILCVVVDIGGLACQLQQNTITLKFDAKDNH